MDSFLTSIADFAIPVIGGDSEEPIDYSLWLKQGADYTPATDLRIEKKLPSGVYKVAFDPHDGYYHFKDVKLNLDELYEFKDTAESVLLQEVSDFWERKSLYEENNVIHKRGILLAGAPGTGKTSVVNLLIKQLLKQDGVVFLITNPNEFTDLYSCLNKVFRKIEPERPVITIIEDVDKLIELMSSDNQVLDLLDGKESISHHLVILTSNNTSSLSPALLRPSRIDTQIIINVPNDDIRREYLLKKGISEDDIDEYVTKTKGLSFADLKEIFIGTQILGKNLDKIIYQIKNPQQATDYLDNKKIGL